MFTFCPFCPINKQIIVIIFFLLLDHDEALAQAIQEATAMNPDMTVEKIEIHQTTQADSQ